MDGDFYEPAWRRAFSSEYADQLAGLLPAGWAMHRKETWLQATGPDGVVAQAGRAVQGFKIHVASTPDHAPRVLGLVAPVCVEHGADFKVAGDPAMLYQLNGKRHARGGSGKFMTIYPPDDRRFRALLEHLHRVTADAGVAGPRVLSDRRYRDSAILSYRYGGFVSPRRVNVDGTHTLCLVAPDGEQVPDERLPYYRLPAWVRDPFGAAPPGDVPSGYVLAGRYRIDEAVAFSNSGGVYHATDTATGEPVVVKEARPFTNPFRVGDRGWDAVHLLRREHAILERLADVPCVPRAVDLLTESDHLFLVEERVGTLSLRAFWASNEIIVSPYVRRPGRLASWTRAFVDVARSLVATVTALHERGVIAGDLSPDNVRIDPATRATWLIDFESAVAGDEDPETLRYAAVWGTTGYRHPDRWRRDRPLAADDLYAVGMVLFAGLAGINPLVALNPGAAASFLDEFVALGLAPAVRDVIVALWEGDVARAGGVLAAWDA